MKMRKIMALVLALVMAFALAATANATSADDGTGSITVENPVDEQTYTAYKIFDVTYDINNVNKADKYSYTISESSPWYKTVETYANKDDASDADGLTLVQSTANSTVYVIKTTQLFSAPEFAAALSAALTDTTNPVEDAGKPLSNGSVDELALGYYFVTTTTGSLCNLTTTNPDVKIYDKNDRTFEKDTTDYSVEIGQEVPYTITGKVPSTEGFASYTYEVTDTMDNGLTFQKNVVVTIDNTTLDKDTDYTVVYTDTGFTLNIDMMKQQDKIAKTVTITYSAIVNEKAVSVISGNNAVLKYSNDPTNLNKTDELKDDVDVYTAKIVIDKYADGDEASKLEGVKFVLKNAAGKFYKYENEAVSWVDSIDDASECTTDALGAVSFIGLEDGTYYIHETETVPGYNLLSSDVQIDLNGTSTLSVTAKINNESGDLLPSTGGMGTTIFYTAGALMVLAAGILLVTKKRMAGMEE